MNVPLLTALTMIGFGSSFLSGLLGIGGAAVLIPLLLYGPPALGVGAVDVRDVSGISSVQILAASLFGLIAHGRRGAADRRLILTLGVSNGLAALAGAFTSKYVPGFWLLAVFAGLAALAAVMMLFPPPRSARESVLHGAAPTLGPPGRRRREEAGAAPVEFSRPLGVALGAAVGFVSGLVGAGGAFIFNPLMIYVLKIPTRTVIGSSLGIVLFTAASGSIGKLATGQVPLWPTLALVLGSLPGALLGGRVSGRVPAHALRYGIAGVTALAAWKLMSQVATEIAYR